MKPTRPCAPFRQEAAPARTSASPRLRRRAWRLLAALTLGLPAGRAAAPPPPHPEVGQRISLNGVSVAYDDDGRTDGPVWTHPGSLALRQMGHTVRCDYDWLRIFRCQPR